MGSQKNAENSPGPQMLRAHNDGVYNRPDSSDPSEENLTRNKQPGNRTHPRGSILRILIEADISMIKWQSHDETKHIPYG